jgi:hypothetical protein
MFPWMLDMAAPLPLPRATGQMCAPARGAGDGARRAAGAPFPLTSAALPNDNAAPGVMTPRAALLLDVVAPRLMSLLHKQQHEERPR